MTESSSGEVLLRVSGLGKTYSSRHGDVQALGDISFSVQRGEFLSIVGPSGAGKTTLLKCISGLMQPSTGSVSLNDTPVNGPPEQMAVVFQDYGRSLFPWMTVADNIELPLKEKRLPRTRRAELVREALEEVGLSGFERSYPWQLSGGMQQRVAIARAVAYEPSILLMDEPFAAVDAQTRAELEDLVRRLWTDLGVTVLFITHDIDESVYLSERVLVLSNRPSTVLDDVQIDLPRERDQITTRGEHRFAELRTHVYRMVRKAKDTHGGGADA